MTVVQSEGLLASMPDQREESKRESKVCLFSGRTPCLQMDEKVQPPSARRRNDAESSYVGFPLALMVDSGCVAICSALFRSCKSWIAQTSRQTSAKNGTALLTTR